MRIRNVWRDCDFQNGEWGATPQDAFWVEATRPEAEAKIFPLMVAGTGAAAPCAAHGAARLARWPEDDDFPHCFLITRDMKSIEALEPHYPYSNLWNGESPFDPIDGTHIKDIDELGAPP